MKRLLPAATAVVAISGFPAEPAPAKSIGTIPAPGGVTVAAVEDRYVA